MAADLRAKADELDDEQDQPPTHLLAGKGPGGKGPSGQPSAPAASARVATVAGRFLTGRRRFPHCLPSFAALLFRLDTRYRNQGGAVRIRSQTRPARAMPCAKGMTQTKCIEFARAAGNGTAHEYDADPSLQRTHRRIHAPPASGATIRSTRWCAAMRSVRPIRSRCAIAIGASPIGNCTRPPMRWRRILRAVACAAASGSRSGCPAGLRASLRCWPARATAMSAARRCIATTRSAR